MTLNERIDRTKAILDNEGNLIITLKKITI